VNNNLNQKMRRTTSLERRVLVAVERGSWASAIAPGYTSSKCFQALKRLISKGLVLLDGYQITAAGASELAKENR